MKILIECGHGGSLWGADMTPGKRSSSIPPGIIEGEFVRRVAQEIYMSANTSYCDVEVLNPGPIDISRPARIKAINKIAQLNPGMLLVSLHTNASPKPGWSEARGSVVFYGDSVRSKKCADTVNIELAQVVPGNRGIKPGRFDLITKTKCDSIMVELFFHTNKEECERFTSQSGFNDLCLALTKGLCRIALKESE